jgi:sensor histidine kinase YesM
MESNSQVSWRAIALGLILIPVNCYWIVYIELVQYSAQPTIVSLIFNVVFSVFVLTLLNLLLKRFLPQLALRQSELLVVYVMLSVASATAGHSMMEILVPILGHAFYHATPENDWSNLLWRHIPEWLSVNDKGALSGYYDGDSTLYTIQQIKSWLTPVMSWVVFLFALVFVMVCINVIVRKQWTEREKLAYPIIQHIRHLT